MSFVQEGRLYLRLHRASAPLSPSGNQSLGGEAFSWEASKTYPAIVHLLTPDLYGVPVSG